MIRIVMAMVLAVTFTMPTAASAQLLRGEGAGARLSRLRDKRGNKDSSIHYDAAILAIGVPSARVHAAFGQPNAVQGEGAAREEVYAFYPDGAKFVDPQVTGATIAAAVFTGGMSLAVNKARTTIEENQLTLYRVHYDEQERSNRCRWCRRRWVRRRHHRNSQFRR